MSSNFDFLQKEFPVLANFGELAEKYCYSDSNSCLIKLGMIGETIVNLMFTYDRISFPRENTAKNRINILLREGLLTEDLSAILHSIRKIRNKATHENYSCIEDSENLLQVAYVLCEWFMQTYGDWSYVNKEFIMPKKEDNNVILSDKTAEAKKEAELTKQAEENALIAPKINVDERRKQVKKAANQREITEAETRILVDEQLRMVGWEADTENIRYSRGIRPKKGRNLAIAEYPTLSSKGNTGHADYALFIGEKLVAIIEAKAMHKDIPSVLDYQGKDYAKNIRKEDEKYIIGTWGDYKVPFIFATNGRPYLEQYKTKSGNWFLDLRRPYNIPEAFQGWMSPDGIEDRLKMDVEEKNKALEDLSYDLLTDKQGLNLREYQLDAIKAAEEAVINGKKEILLAMATGTGKTRTVLGMIYRFIKTERFHRILFLVDRTALGDQAQGVFEEVNLENLLTLDKIYYIKGLSERVIEKETRVHISTVQGMVSRIFYNSGEVMPAISDYDLIIVDEAHRGYILDKEMTEDEAMFKDQRDYQSKYRKVIEYFDAVKIGLTATPAPQTREIFGSPVFTYSYREAVIGGYLVDHDPPHELRTKLSKEGIHYKKGETVVEYDPITGEIVNSELLEDELDFDIETFNRRVITESFNRAVLEEIAKNIDPDAPKEQGKTLIYAVNDNHADLIVEILRDIYKKTESDNGAIVKITGSAAGGDKERIKEEIRKFKNEDYPSVVVTVDLLTTGIDVPSISTLVFMRRVKSRILFEQMLGRATRLCKEIHKKHFQIYDPVGVYDSLQDYNTMRPVVANPLTSFTGLLEELREMKDEAYVKNQINQVIAKLQRKKNDMDSNTMEQFKDMTGGKNVEEFIIDIKNRNAEDAKNTVLSYYNLFKYVQESRTNDRKIVVSYVEDELISHTRGYGKRGIRPEDYLEEFSNYVQNNMNEIAALKIVCTRPQDLTRESLKSLRLTLDREGFSALQLNTAISQLTNEEMAADIISIIRKYALGSSLISHEARIRNAVKKLCRSHEFTKQEQTWIKRMEDYLLNESVLNIQVFDEDSRFKAQGGFSKVNKVFENKLESIVLELNKYLYEDGGRIA